MDGWLEEREGAGHTHPSQTLSVTLVSTPLACVKQGTSQGYGLSQAKGEIGCVLQTPRAAARAAYKPGSCGTHGKSGDSTQNSQSQTMAQSGQDHPALTCPRTHPLHLKPLAPTVQGSRKTHTGSEPGRKAAVIPEANGLPLSWIVS